MRASYTPSGLLFLLVIGLGMLLILSAVIAAQFYGRDVVASLSYFSDDGSWSSVPSENCQLATEGIGRHCFGDYTLTARYATQANPWDLYLGHQFNYPAAGMIPHLLLGGLGLLVGAPRVGLVIFLVILAAALVVPAIWASKGKGFVVRLVTFGAFGLLSIPAIMTLDRGNNIGLAVPFLLAYLVSIRRGNYAVTSAAIILATMVKPQFAVLLLTLLLARKWKHFGVTIAGIVATNVLAFLLWPRDFPATIVEWARNAVGYGASVSLASQYPSNVSFSKGFYLIESVVRGLVGLTTEPGRIESLSGFVFVALIAVGLVIIGARLPLHISAIILLVSASMCLGTSWAYYLVFGLPIAAVLLRDPVGAEFDRWRWSGMLDSVEGPTRVQRASAALIVVATALTVSRVLLPNVITFAGSDRTDIVSTSAELVPIMWIFAIVLTMIAWGVRRPFLNAATS